MATVPPEPPPRADADGSDDAWRFETLTDAETPAAPPAAPLLQEGDFLLERFKVVRLVGAGGMGEVYEARDQRLQVTVALKTIRAARATDAALVERLKREVTLARAVSHSNVCRVFDLHETDFRGVSLVFISMEYLDGETLSHRLRRTGPLSASESLALLRQATDGLTAIHATGLVHRDLKPGNLLLVPEGASVRLVVTDFGLARPLVARSSDDGWERSEGRPVRGSPSYMSPEQLAGAEVTPRSDLYALGLVAHAMVTGAPPVDGRLGAVPRNWKRPLRKALQAEPAKRFATPSQLLAALSGHAQARRATWALIAAALLGFLAASALLARHFHAAAPSAAAARASIAVLPFANLSGVPDDDYFAEGLTEDILTALSRVQDLRLVSGAPHGGSRGMKSARALAEELRVRTVLEGSIRRDGGRLRIVVQLIDGSTDEHLWAETYDRDVGNLLAVQTDVASKVVTALAVHLAPADTGRLGDGATANAAAYDHYLRGLYWVDRWQMVSDNQHAMSEFEEAVALDPQYALAHAQLGLALAHNFLLGGTRDEAFVDKANREADRALELAPGIAVPHLMRSELLYSAHGHWDYEGAIREAQLVADREPRLGHQQLAKLYANIGMEEPAIQEAELALAVNPSPSVQYTLLVVLGNTGNWSEAIARSRMFKFPNYLQSPLNAARLRVGELLALEDATAPGSPNMDKAITLALRGKWEQADVEARKAIADFDPNRRAYFSDQYDVACFEAIMGRKDEAVRWLRLAAKNGLPNYLLFIRDPLLEQIRTQPGYVKLLAELKPRWERWRTMYH